VHATASFSGHAACPYTERVYSTPQTITDRDAARPGDCVLVTGATSQLGWMTSLAFAENGFRVLAVDRLPIPRFPTSYSNRRVETQQTVLDVLDADALQRLLFR
jgi:NADP-dependent 3-hydroxy acid dehydrogenase YdfG